MSTLKTTYIQHPSASSPAIALDANGGITGGFPAGGRNKIINGGFDVWQRGTSIAFAGTAYQYMSDRWKTVRGAFATGMTVSQQAAGLTGFRWCSRSQRDSGNTSTQYLEMMQTLETSESVKLAGSTITFSFYARAGANYSSASNALGFYAFYGTGIDQANENFTGRTNILSQTATLTTAWQRFSATVAIPSNATGLSFGFSYNPTGTAGAADYFEVTGVQVETGVIATPFEFKPYADELRYCQRYYYRLIPTGGYSRLGVGFAVTTTYAQAVIPFPVPMRVPTITFEQSGTAANYGIAFLATSAACNAVPAWVTGNTANGTVNFFASGLTAGNGVTVCDYGTANAFLGFSSEL